MRSFAISTLFAYLAAAIPSLNSIVNSSSSPSAEATPTLHRCAQHFDRQHNLPGTVYVCSDTMGKGRCEYHEAVYAPKKPVCYRGFPEANNTFWTVRPDQWTKCLGFADGECAGEKIWEGIPPYDNPWGGMNPNSGPDYPLVRSLVCFAHFGEVEDPNWDYHVPQPEPTGVQCFGLYKPFEPLATSNTSTQSKTLKSVTSHANTLLPSNKTLNANEIAVEDSTGTPITMPLSESLKPVKTYANTLLPNNKTRNAKETGVDDSTGTPFTMVLSETVAPVENTAIASTSTSAETSTLSKTTKPSEIPTSSKAWGGEMAPPIIKPSTSSELSEPCILTSQSDTASVPTNITQLSVSGGMYRPPLTEA